MKQLATLLFLVIGVSKVWALPPCNPSSKVWHNCYGTHTYASGNKYEGRWQNNKKNGPGTAIFADGTTYLGGWRDGKMHGQGTYFFPDGVKYVGEFKDSRFHGQGTYTRTNAVSYTHLTLPTILLV